MYVLILTYVRTYQFAVSIAYVLKHKSTSNENHILNSYMINLYPIQA